VIVVGSVVDSVDTLAGSGDEGQTSDDGGRTNTESYDCR